MIKGKAKLPDFFETDTEGFFGVYFRGKPAMESHLMNIGHFGVQDISLQVKINMTLSRSNLKLAYSLYANSSVGFHVQKKGGRIKLLFIGYID